MNSTGKGGTKLRLAWVFLAGDPACLRPYLWLREGDDCTESSFDLQRTFLALRYLIIAPHNVEVQLIPAIGWSPSASLNDSSVVTLIHRNQADISAAYMGLSLERFKYVQYSVPLWRAPISADLSPPSKSYGCPRV